MVQSLRERKKEKNRQIMIETASKLFLEKGFDNTTADEIAEQGDISRSTFFRYFPTKDAVVFPYQHERIEQLRQYIINYEDRYPPFQAVCRGVLDMGRYYMSIVDDLRVQRRIVSTSTTLQARQVEFDDSWEGVIAERMMVRHSGRTNMERQARYVAAAVFGTIEAVLREWFENDCSEDLVEMGREGLSLIEIGVKNTEFNK